MSEQNPPGHPDYPYPDSHQPYDENSAHQPSRFRSSRPFRVTLVALIFGGIAAAIILVVGFGGIIFGVFTTDHYSLEDAPSEKYRITADSFSEDAVFLDLDPYTKSSGINRLSNDSQHTYGIFISSNIVAAAVLDNNEYYLVGIDYRQQQISWTTQINGPAQCVEDAFIYCIVDESLIRVNGSTGESIEMAHVPANTRIISADPFILSSTGQTSADHEVITDESGQELMIAPWQPPSEQCSQITTSLSWVFQEVNKKYIQVQYDGWSVVSELDTGEIIAQGYGSIVQATDGFIFSGYQECGQESTYFTPNRDQSAPRGSLLSETVDSSVQIPHGVSTNQWIIADDQLNRTTIDKPASPNQQLGGTSMPGASDHSAWVQRVSLNTMELGKPKLANTCDVISSGNYIASVHNNSRESPELAWKSEVLPTDSTWWAGAGAVVVNDGDGSITAYSLTDGSQLWDLDASGTSWTINKAFLPIAPWDPDESVTFIAADDQSLTVYSTA